MEFILYCFDELKESLCKHIEINVNVIKASTCYLCSRYLT